MRTCDRCDKSLRVVWVNAATGERICHACVEGADEEYARPLPPRPGTVDVFGKVYPPDPAYTMPRCPSRPDPAPSRPPLPPPREIREGRVPPRPGQSWLARLACRWLGHWWHIDAVDGRHIYLMHLSPIAGARAHCLRCGEQWDDTRPEPEDRSR